MINRTIEKAIQVSFSDISVLVVGESGVGKEFIPKIIHYLSSRKHNCYIAINCGAIPEGTIDSELFGHKKGSFTGAFSTRRGYFDVANGGTIFLDEVGELPLSTQVRLLRVLESGEFMKVGSSLMNKTSVRVVAATNINLLKAIEKKKFREDLYYRLNTVQIDVPPLRYRKEDISLLFNSFSNSFAERNKIPPIRLTDESIKYLENYYWPGNIRQLRNLSEKISILEIDRNIDLNKIKQYLPENKNSLPIIINNKRKITFHTLNKRDLFYKTLFEIKKDINDFKTSILQIIKNNNNLKLLIDKKRQFFNDKILSLFHKSFNKKNILKLENLIIPPFKINDNKIISKESCILQNNELNSIREALKKNNGKRKITAKQLGISERTLYRKIKQYEL